MSYSPTEDLPIMGVIPPQSVAADATVQSDVVDISKFEQFLVVANLGDYGAGNDGEITFGVYLDTAVGGSFATLMTGKVLTTATFTGSTGDSKLATIQVRSQAVGVQGNAGYRYFRVKATPTNQLMFVSAVILGCGPRFSPGNQFDIAAVAEILSD